MQVARALDELLEGLRRRNYQEQQSIWYKTIKIGTGTCPDEPHPADNILPPSADEAASLHHIVMSNCRNIENRKIVETMAVLWIRIRIQKLNPYSQYRSGSTHENIG